MVVFKNKDRKIKKKGLWSYEFQYMGERRKKAGFLREKDAQDAEDEEKAKIRKMKSGQFEIEDDMAEYIQKWLDGRRNLGDNTRGTYQTYLNNHIKPFFKNKAVNKIKPQDVEDFINTMHDKELSSSTIKKGYNIINKFFNDQIKRRMLEYNPCSGIEKPKERNKKVEVFDRNELVEFLKFSEDYTRYSFAFKLAAFTGLRRGELLALKWDCIDLENKVINVKRRLVREKMGTDEYIQDGTKTGNTRFVTFGEQIRQDIIKHQQIQEYEKENNEYTDRNLVFSTQNGNFVSVDNLSRIFRNTLKKSPIDKQLGFHSLRHTHATLSLLKGIDMKVVSERLGHSSIKITMDIYAHLLPEQKTEAADKFEQMFEE